jgi:DNA processing protein
MESTHPDETAALLALLRGPALGRHLLPTLRDPGQTASGLLARPPTDLPPKVKAYLAAPDWGGVERDLEWLQAPGNRLVGFTDAAYPERLRMLADPPLALFMRGDPDLLGLPQLAIVGSRHPTTGGARTARQFAAHLAAGGLVISSGLAAGIDAAAHDGALAADGLTLAVAGTGLDRVYPADNRELAHRIAGAGLLISEFPIGTPPRPGNFPRRNRIIAGLALGTLVVEAALQSGSLITARLAGEAGREVFAIPGSIHNPMARGCHRLIRDGAKLVETADDVLEELGPLLSDRVLAPAASDSVANDSEPESLDSQERDVLAAMGFDPTTTDEIVERTGFPANEVSSILLLLEMRGHVSSGAGGQFTRLGIQPE